MKRSSIARRLIFGIALTGVFAVSASAQSATLFSPFKYRGEQRRNCVTLIDQEHRKYRPCDVRYGSLYIGEERDWFESSGAQGNRSVIKDLGVHSWSDGIDVPLVAALPALKPGEVRQVKIDSSGADGAAGRPGANGAPGNDRAFGANAGGGSIEARTGVGLTSRAETERPDEYSARVYDALKTPTPTGPKKDGKPRVDPMFVKAVAGHMYVIHVVDDNNDFYALFRVDELLRGDSVLISWKFVDSPK